MGFYFNSPSNIIMSNNWFLENRGLAILSSCVCSHVYSMAPHFPEFSILVAYFNVEHASSLYVRPADFSSSTPQKLRRVLLHKYIYIIYIGIHVHIYIIFYSTFPSSASPFFRLRTWATRRTQTCVNQYLTLLCSAGSQTKTLLLTLDLPFNLRHKCI